jgi:hypothetical protein
MFANFSRNLDVSQPQNNSMTEVGEDCNRASQSDAGNDVREEKEAKVGVDDQNEKERKWVRDLRKAQRRGEEIIAESQILQRRNESLRMQVLSNRNLTHTLSNSTSALPPSFFQNSSLHSRFSDASDRMESGASFSNPSLAIPTPLPVSPFSSTSDPSHPIIAPSTICWGDDLVLNDIATFTSETQCSNRGDFSGSKRKMEQSKIENTKKMKTILSIKVSLMDF